MNFIHTQRLPAIFVPYLTVGSQSEHGAPRGSIVRLFVRLHLTVITQGKNDGFRLSTHERRAKALRALHTKGVQNSTA
jgi:hypothetical protein